jgi:hypothetical protein
METDNKINDPNNVVYLSDYRPLVDKVLDYERGQRRINRQGSRKLAGNVINLSDYRPPINKAFAHARAMQRHPSYQGELTKDEDGELTALLNMLDVGEAELLQTTINAARLKNPNRILLDTLKYRFQHRR